MTKLRIATILGALGLALATAPASHAAGSYYGCPYGAVCIYNGGPQDGSHPTGAPQKRAIFYSYGAHNLSHELGMHFIVDNQYGGAGNVGCVGYNGGGGEAWGFTPGGHHLEAANLTPVNSINLTVRSQGYEFYKLANCYGE